jgi:hypothetical protein
MEFFTFRVNKLKILNNREWGAGELKLLSFITGENVNLPVLDDLQRTTDPVLKKQIILAATQSVLSAKILMQLDNVRDGHIMTFGDTGYSLHTTDRIPVSFNWSLMLLKIEEDINNLGKKIDGVINAPEFNGFVNNVPGSSSRSCDRKICVRISCRHYD